MTSLKLKIAFIGIALLLGACTNRSSIKTFPDNFNASTVASQIQTVADFQYQGKDSQNFAVGTYQGRLFATGTQYGFLAVDVSATPESPTLVMDILTGGINLFSSIGSWVVGFYASKSIAFSGNYAITSGTGGASVIRIFGSGSPKEEARFPMPDAQGNPVQDTAFVWEAAVGHPTLPLIYAFQRDYIEVVDASHLPQLTIRQKFAYPNNVTCCAMRATFFGANRLVVAMRSRLWTFTVDSSGTLGALSENTTLQAVDVTSTDQLLYVHHQQNNSTGAVLSTGVYLFDANGAGVRYLPYDPAGHMAVSPNNADMYNPNPSNNAIDISRILWTN